MGLTEGTLLMVVTGVGRVWLEEASISHPSKDEDKATHVQWL